MGHTHNFLQKVVETGIKTTVLPDITIKSKKEKYSEPTRVDYFYKLLSDHYVYKDYQGHSPSGAEKPLESITLEQALANSKNPFEGYLLQQIILIKGKLTDKNGNILCEDEAIPFERLLIKNSLLIKQCIRNFLKGTALEGMCNFYDYNYIYRMLLCALYPNRRVTSQVTLTDKYVATIQSDCKLAFTKHLFEEANRCLAYPPLTDKDKERMRDIIQKLEMLYGVPPGQRSLKNIWKDIDMKQAHKSALFPYIDFMCTYYRVQSITSNFFDHKYVEDCKMLAKKTGFFDEDTLNLDISQGYLFGGIRDSVSKEPQFLDEETGAMCSGPKNVLDLLERQIARVISDLLEKGDVEAVEDKLDDCVLYCRYLLPYDDNNAVKQILDNIYYEILCPIDTIKVKDAQTILNTCKKTIIRS